MSSVDGVKLSSANLSDTLWIWPVVGETMGVGDMRLDVGLFTQKGTRPVTHANSVTPNAQMSACAQRFLSFTRKRCVGLS